MKTSPKYFVVLLPLAVLTLGATESSAALSTFVVEGSACVPIQGFGGPLDPTRFYALTSNPASVQVSQWGITTSSQVSGQRVFCPLPDLDFSGPAAGSYLVSGGIGAGATVYNRSSSSQFTCVFFTNDANGNLLGTDTESTGFTGSGLTPATLSFVVNAGDPATAGLMCDIPALAGVNLNSWLTNISYAYTS